MNTDQGLTWPPRTAGLTLGREVRTLLDVVGPVLHVTAAAIWRPDGLRKRYLKYLSAMHGVIRASVPLMELAASRCADAGRKRLREYFDEHIEEEQHHDEWLREDLRLLGSDLDSAPSPTVARLVGAQYYWVSHHDPVCLLGYIAVLEGNSPAPTLAGELAARTGFSSDAFRTLHHHAVVDTEHSRAVYDLLDELPATAGQRQAVRVSALQTVAGLADLFHEIAREPAAGGKWTR
jgi:hypothetical protein